MTGTPLLQLWKRGTTTCRVSPVTESAPYWVVIQHGDESALPRGFDTHDEAVGYAVEELRHPLVVPILDDGSRMSAPALVTLWQHGTFTCRITPADEIAPYWVIVHESDEPISWECFDTYEEALTHASGELRHAIAAENPHDE